MWEKYGKLIGPVLVAIVVAIQAALSGDGNVSTEEAFQITVAGLTAVGVWLVPEFQAFPWVKTAQAVLLAAVTAAGSLILDGISAHDVTAIVLAVLGVIWTASAPAVRH